MKQPSTDREILRKGIINMGICLPMMFLGPILIYIGAGHDHPVVFLFPGIVFSGVGVFLMFRGIILIVDSMFKSDKHR